MSEDLKDVIEVDFAWADSQTYVKSIEGTLIPAGTIIKLISQILFLEPLTLEQLKNLKLTVNEAVDHELKKRELL